MTDAIETGRRVQLLFEDETVQDALKRLREENYRLFLGAPTDAGRLAAQAQAVALEGFERALRGIVDAGERERLEAERRERAPSTR